MSTISSLSSLDSSSSVTYATQLAQTAKLRRMLNDLGTAIDKGDLTGAGTAMTSIANAFPQYAVSSSGSSQSQDPINKGFQAISNAIANNQVDAAQSAWAQLKTDLASSGVKDISDGTGATAQLLADTKSSVDQTILSDIFGGNSSGGLSVPDLIGGSGNSSGSDAVSSLVSDWITYQAGGTTANPATTQNTGTNLNTTA